MNASLYDIEENLAALIDTADLVDTPEQQEEIFQEIRASLTQAVEKRDRVSQFLAHCEGQQATIDAEMKRLQALKKSYAKTQERVEGYIVRTIQALGTDEKGRYRKLEGQTCVLSLRANPPSVDVRDEAAVPMAFKTFSVVVPGLAWKRLLDSVEPEELEAFLSALSKTETAINKQSVKDAINGGNEVPGAVLTGKTTETKKYSLSRR